MQSGRKLRLSPEASSDIGALLQYTIENWGVEQMRAYQHLLDSTLTELAAFPEIGTSVEAISPILRRHPVGRHVIYYRVFPNEVVVHRVFHQSREVPKNIEVE